jgi:hypothetical protein
MPNTDDDPIHIGMQWSVRSIKIAVWHKVRESRIRFGPIKTRHIAPKSYPQDEKDKQIQSEPTKDKGSIDHAIK